MPKFCRNGHDKDVVGTRPSGQCTTCANANYRRWYQKTYPDWKDENNESRRRKNLAEDAVNQLREYDRARWAKKAYKLSDEELERMKREQNGKCSLCQQPSERLEIDHDHITQRVRKLLCRKCNAGLGQFNDDPDLLACAREYVIKHRSEPD